VITWKGLNRWGWILTVSTILTALSVVPIVTERNSLNWLEWFGTPAGLFMRLFQPTSDAGFLTLGAFGLAINILVLAVSLELVRLGIRLVRKPRASHA
jgi:hypothetical protein